MAHNVFLVEVDDTDSLDITEDVKCFDETALLGVGKVYLRHIARNDHLRVPPHTGEKHANLCGGGILGLVQNDDSVA